MNHHSGDIIAERDGLRVIDCRACGYAHLERIPSSAELRAYYAGKFWETDKVGELALYEDRRAWWAMFHSDMLSRLERITLGRTLLDVGCGYGFFMQTAQRRGWNTIGVEPSPKAVEYCRANGQAIYQREWDDQTTNSKFDSISALWLIEHLPSPMQFLKRCHQHLYSSGVLLVVCPNEWTRVQAEANEKVEKKYWFAEKSHINYFSMATLGNLLGRAGFQVVEWMASDPIEHFIIDGQGNYVDHPELGPKLHADIETWEMEMTQSYRLTMARRRARRAEGRDIIAVARVDA